MNILPAASDREVGVPELHVDFSRKCCSVHLIVIFSNSAVCRLLEGQVFHAVNSVFPIIDPYIDLEARFQRKRIWLVSTSVIPNMCLM